MEIFVGCSSSENVDKKYLELGETVGTLIAKNGHNLIFGSSEDGMLGCVYHSVVNNGGKVTAIIPNEYRGWLTEVKANKVITTPTATDQLKMLVNSGDATIIMPGSYGTIAELSASIQNKKLGEHNKKIYILNTYGFFDDLINLFDKIYDDKFDSYDKDLLFKVVNDPNDIFKDLNEKNI